MEIVPVIDLKGGVVVRARHGDRANYQPIVTPLSQSSDALDVIAGLLALRPFRSLYVADLDAIEKREGNFALLQVIARRFPDLILWVDNGCAERSAAAALLAELPTAQLVLGSESQTSAALLRALRDEPRLILSLDFRGDTFLGPPELLGAPDLWPQWIIVMSLAKVGGGAGPDFDRLAQVRAAAGNRHIYLAGGLRGRGDLAALVAGGAAGILVASALHDGTLTGADMAEC